MHARILFWNSESWTQANIRMSNIGPDSGEFPHWLKFICAQLQTMSQPGGNGRIKTIIIGIAKG